MMKPSAASIRSLDLRRIALVAFAAAAVALASTRAHAADPAETGAIALSAPLVKDVGLDAQTAAPLAEVSVAARVQFDPATLTTGQGVAFLRQGVLDAAGKACIAVLAQDYGTCVREALVTAEPQIDAALARAKSAAGS